jgi:hypothetical protein
MGKNVKGFELGDRCVADVGLTVSLLQKEIQPEYSTSLQNDSATTVSIVDVAILSCVRISMLGVSLSMVDSPSTSYSKRVIHLHYM